MLNSALEWVNERAPWMVFIILSITGGAVAHIRTYETAKIDMSFKQHFWALVRRSVVSGFAGVLIYLAAHAQGFAGSPWAFFLAGLCGLFSAEFFDLAWRVASSRFQQNPPGPKV